MKVLMISGSGERELFSGNLIECLKESIANREKTKFAVVIESDNLKRLSMSEQDIILKRLRINHASLPN